ncbi:hypothetical protein PR048_021304 [Dryococelus australis]|uniref:Integrase catalytic domain-containing protein n=1 Tax=Dryococelus australis TaxID=614101 RepID=A0ABQ9GXT9_9NEOP|nr:hypothetical protein PR048_021304 [Dryococelus australis]
MFGPLLLSRDGNNCILILMDSFSKFTFMIPLWDMKAGNIAKALINKAWQIFADQEQIITDNSIYMRLKTCFEWGVKHINTSPYYPCPNIVECVNEKVKLGSKSPEKSLAFNSTGFSQCKVFLGHELPVPLLNVWGIPPEAMEINSSKELEDIWNDTCSNLEKARTTTAKRYNTVGELVVCRHYVQSRKVRHILAKLATPYDGPFKILHFLGPGEESFVTQGPVRLDVCKRESAVLHRPSMLLIKHHGEKCVLDLWQAVSRQLPYSDMCMRLLIITRVETPSPDQLILMGWYIAAAKQRTSCAHAGAGP